VIIIVIVIIMLTTLVDLPAFSWLIRNTLPALLFTIPVIFMPELRRALERLGRAGSGALLPEREKTDLEVIQRMIKAVVSASSRLSVFRQGALIILQRRDSLREYEETGVKMGAQVTPELLLQIFYPNTPLHDGAAILVGDRISAAACVMPLSSSGAQQLTGSSDGTAPPGCPGYLRSHRRHRSGGIRGDRLHFAGTPRAHPAAHQRGQTRERADGFLPAAGRSSGKSQPSAFVQFHLQESSGREGLI
jgi:hypothetical protein